MKKTKLYLMIFLLTVIIFITAAATFNMCGIPVEVNVGSSAEEEKAEDPDSTKQVEEKAGEEKPAPEDDMVLDEDIELPGLAVQKESEKIALEEFNAAVSGVVEEVTSQVVNIKVKVIYVDKFGEERIAEGVGSGVIYTEDGYIITNHHVVQDVSEILVTDFNGDEYPARLVGSHKDTDIAVLKIEAGDISAASFTSIEDVKVGEMAIAIGSPFGLSQTVTVGVISAKGRDIAVSSDAFPMVDLIQTDAAINRGNSGGPLINASGQVIGINSIIFSPSGANAGIGFAIPSDTAIVIAGQIIRYGKARIPVVGVNMGDNETEIKGVYIKNVMDGFPADEAGIKSGDIIVEFDEVKILTPYMFFAQILRHDVGDIVRLKIYREGEYITKELALVEIS